MSIPVSNTNSTPPAPSGQDAAQRDQAKVKDGNQSNKVKDVESPASAMAQSRASLNSAIVQTSMNVALQSGNDPLALLYKTAIEGINQALAPQLGKDAVANAATGQDNTADATASRIVSMSTALYGKYLEKNKLEDNEASRGKFIDVISVGFEQGFKEAQDVLGGLKVLDGDIAASIDKTRELVLKGFAEFRAPTVDGAPTILPILT